MQALNEKLSVANDKLSEQRAAHAQELRAAQQKHADALGYVEREVSAMRALWTTKEKELVERHEQAKLQAEQQSKQNAEQLKLVNEQLATAQSALAQKQQVPTPL
jgi:hypothetical protein